MFTSKIISISDLERVLVFLSKQFSIYFPVKRGNSYFMSQLREIPKLKISEYRTAEPIKSFYLPAKEDLTHPLEEPLLLFGIKACDLHSLKVLDYVYLEGEFQDEYYTQRRRNNFIFSTDCTNYKDVCFCTSLGYKPYPQDGYDLNLAKLDEGKFVLEIGSEKGHKILEEGEFNFPGTDDLVLQKLAENRKQIYNLVRENADKYLSLDVKDELTPAVRDNFDSEIWQKEAERCVECGACTNVCGSCHCFFLITKKDNLDKLRSWDSCLLRTYALVAGGANPRKRLFQRLRNRFLKKFDFFPQVLNTFGCTGCGRCVTACLGNIDIRKVLNELVSAYVEK